MAETEYQHVPRTESEMLKLLNDLTTPLEGNIHRDIVGSLFELVLRSMVDAGYTDVQVEMAKGSFRDLAARLDAGEAHVDDIIADVNSKLGELGAVATFKGSDTRANINAKTGMQVGDEWYDTTNQQSLRWNGTAWVAVGGTIKLGRGSVISDKIDRIEKIGNLYEYVNNYIPDSFINTSGQVSPVAGWGYGKVPISGSGTYSVWMPNGDYTSLIGSIGLFKGDALVDYIYGREYKLGQGTAVIGGNYNGSDYLTFTVPAGVDNVRVTNKRPGDGSFDDSLTMVVIKGDVVSDRMLQSGITRLFGAPLVDEGARSKLNDVEISGGNLYDFETDFVPDYFIHIVGAPSANVGWGYGRVPISGSGTYSVWMPNGDYTGSIGSIGLYKGDVLVDYIYNYDYKLGQGTAVIGGNYKGYDYLTFTVPSGVDNIRVTNKRPGADPFDDSLTMVLVKNSVVNDEVLQSGITKLFGHALKGTQSHVGKKWAAAGDSLTEVNRRSTKFYHQYVADDIGIEVVNLGQSGTGYKRTDTNNTAFYQRMSSVPLDADVVTVFGSFNDLGSGVPIGTKDDTGTATLGGAINTTIDNLFSRLPTVPLGIISPTPWQHANPFNGSTQGNQYVALLEEICTKRGIPFLDLYHESGLRPWEESYRALMYSRDDGNGVHPDENGHKLFYPKIREFIRVLI